MNSLARKEKTFEHDRESAIKLNEKIKRTIALGSKDLRIFNFTVLKYDDNRDKETEDIVQFGYNGSEKIVKMYFKQLFNPRSSPSPLCLQEFVKPERHIGMCEAYDAMFQEVKQFIYHNNPIVYHLVSLGAFSTYFPEIFETYPYFDFFGAQESCGKTTFLEVLTYASYYSEFMTVPTLAPIFRTVHEYNCMLGIDEFGKLIVNKDNRDLLAMILVGHKKGGTVPRMEEGLEKVKRFDVFGLKAWTRLEPLPPELLSRAITITMVRNDGRKKLKGSLTFETLTNVRDNFYLCRLENFNAVQKAYNQLKKELELYDRTKDVFLPLLTIAYLADSGVYQNVLEFALAYQKEFTVGHIDHWLFLLLEVIIEGSFFGEVQVSAIRDDFRQKLISAQEINDKDDETRKITSKKVINYLERLGFKKSPKKTGGLVYIDIRRKKFDEQAYVYLKESDVYKEYHKNNTDGSSTLTDAENKILQVSKTKTKKTTKAPSIEENPTSPTIPTNDTEAEFEQLVVKTTKKKNPCKGCSHVHIGNNQCRTRLEPYATIDKFCDYEIERSE